MIKHQITNRGTVRRFSNGWHVYIGRGIWRKFSRVTGWALDWRARA